MPNEDTRLWLYGVARRVLANACRGEMRRDRLGEMQSPDFEAFAAGAITGADVLESVRSSGTDLSRVIGFDPVGLNVELHASES